MKYYYCVECPQTPELVYDDSTKPDNFICQRAECPGNGLTGLVIEAPYPGGGGTKVPIAQEVGLCVLLMDASGSMFFDPAFKGQRFPSTFGNAFLNKAEMVSKCAANAIFQLKDISLKKHQEAYIMAIKFDHNQSLMFLKPIKELIQEFGEAVNFAKYLYEELEQMKGGTNINSALEMAYSFISKFKEGNIPGIGDFEPMYDSIHLPNKGGDYEIPNIRAMIYTDGEQLAEYGALQNPFMEHDPDLLLGAFIGDQSEVGCDQLRNIVSKCPIHNQDQFFIIDSPQSQSTLRRLFRMASDASGFCPSCIAPTQLR
ncbi:VWA domain-containing protein [Polaribacter vadi]|uniref:vWA domain-containing protein n=1 Tax=Polaribacter TaxID=52959 RepID=UPI001C08CB9C|nr:MULTISPECIES: vWA domain-containing protein [Polaribacter]MBU3012676.1 VWA domain-containing protein [Polaribacter vadi]MDO6742493.1 vWA domain-containing protein [Polaribacter sp. 1_MG-2023]